MLCPQGLLFPYLVGTVANHQADSSFCFRRQDLESQKPEPTQAELAALSAAQNAAHGVHYARGGRGGAGNFTDAATAAAAQVALARETLAKAHDPSTSAAADPTPAAAAPSRPAYSGRGGAGNWAASATANARALEAKEKDEARRREKVDEGVVRDVDAGLAPPPQARTVGHLRDGAVAGS